MKKYGFHLLAAFLIAACVLTLQIHRKGIQPPVADALSYLHIAHDLHQTGIFGNGLLSTSPGTVTPGRFVTPLYPAFLSTMMTLDADFTTSVRCFLTTESSQAVSTCPRDFGFVIGVQIVLGALGIVAVWVLGRQITGSTLGAWFAFLVLLTSREYLLYSGHFLTEALYTPLLALSSVGLVAWIQTQRWPAAALTGAALALTILCRPSPLYFLYTATLVALVIAVAGSPSLRRQRLRAVAALAAAALAVLGPWMLRNYVQFGTVALSEGYAPFIFVQRVSYNMMSWQEWAVSFVYWFPDIGDDLARRFFSPDLYERLGWYGPNTYYTVAGTLFETHQDALAAYNGDAMKYLWHEWVFNQPLKHIATSIALSWRGVWIDKWWGVIGILMLIPATFRMIRLRRMDFLALVGLGFFMVGLNGFISVSIPRYNLALAPVLALSAVLVLAPLGRFLSSLVKPDQRQ